MHFLETNWYIISKDSLVNHAKSFSESEFFTVSSYHKNYYHIRKKLSLTKLLSTTMMAAIQLFYCFQGTTKRQ